MKKLYASFNSLIRRILPVFMCIFVLSCVSFFALMSSGLVNSDDGLWEYSYYKAGKWSLQLGRWLWLYVDRIKLGLSVEPMTSLFSLGLYSLGMTLVSDLFGFTKGRKKQLVYACLTGTLGVVSVPVCISLSYRFNAPAFALGFLFSILAVLCILKIRNKFLAVFSGGLFIAFSMGLYQAYIGCTCVVLLSYLIVSLFEEKELKDTLYAILRAFISAIIGAVLYILILNAHLWLFHLEMADYNGANTYSVISTITNLPFSIVNTFRVFGRYFTENYFHINSFQNFHIHNLVFVMVFIFLAYRVVCQIINKKWHCILALVFLIMYPVASNAVLLIAVSAWTTLQMTVPMAMVIPMMLLVCFKLGENEKPKLDTLFDIILSFALIVVLYGNYMQVQIDQESLKSGQKSTENIAAQIVETVSEQGLYDTFRYTYCIYGKPAGSSMYYFNRISEQANSYALFGNWLSNNNVCMRRSWQGTFSYLLGINLPIGTAEDYSTVAMNIDVAGMNSFPKEGSIVVWGQYVIIKVSD